MKNPQKVTRVKLQIDQIDDFILLGLVSSEPDYKLSLILNKEFGISLKNNSPVILTTSTGSELLFSRFSDTSGAPDRIFNLVCNRSGKHFLIRKLKNVDYVFHIHDPDNKKSISQITSRLRELTVITAVFSIDFVSFKDKNLHLVIQ